MLGLAAHGDEFAAAEPSGQAHDKKCMNSFIITKGTGFKSFLFFFFPRPHTNVSASHERRALK